MSECVDFGSPRFKCTGERKHCSACRRDHDYDMRKRREAKRRAAKAKR